MVARIASTAGEDVGAPLGGGAAIDDSSGTEATATPPARHRRLLLRLLICRLRPQRSRSSASVRPRPRRCRFHFSRRGPLLPLPPPRLLLLTLEDFRRGVDGVVPRVEEEPAASMPAPSMRTRRRRSSKKAAVGLGHARRLRGVAPDGAPPVPPAAEKGFHLLRELLASLSLASSSSSSSTSSSSSSNSSNVLALLPAGAPF